jgi:lipopolysaccharide transport system permease protein
MSVTKGEMLEGLERGVPADQARPAPEVGRELPDEPVVRIRPSRGWVPLDLKAVWDYRELFYFMIWRDLKLRYRQTALGVVWVILQPLATMIVFTFLFGRLAGLPSEGVPYALFAFAGLLPWLFFSGSISRSSNSVVGSANLITKVYFPRVIVPAAAIGAVLVDFAVSFAVMFALMFWYGVALTWHILLLPALVLLIAMLALGVGMWASALNVRYRDIGVIIPFVVNLGMFVTPVIYPLSLIPERWRWLFRLNPLTGIIEGFRAALFGRAFDWASLGISAAITIVVFIWAAYSFRRMERDFADII